LAHPDSRYGSIQPVGGVEEADAAHQPGETRGQDTRFIYPIRRPTVTRQRFGDAVQDGV
jgi:hypothetical protein